MGKHRCRSVLVVSFVVMSGCSLLGSELTVTYPHRTVPRPECNDNARYPYLDFAAFVGSAALAGISTQTACSGGDCSDGKRALLTTLVPTLLFGYSTYIGFKHLSRCQRAKSKYNSWLNTHSYKRDEDSRITGEPSPEHRKLQRPKHCQQYYEAIQTAKSSKERVTIIRKMPTVCLK